MGFKKVRPRKKVCIFCKNKNQAIDYKDVELLKIYLSERKDISSARDRDLCQTPEIGGTGH